MNILAIGNIFNYDNESIVSAHYNSDTSLYDYDICILDPISIETELGNYLTESDLERRNEEILEFLKLGRTVVFFLPPPKKFLVLSKSFNLLDMIPFDFSTKTASGYQIQYQDKESFNDFWKSIKSNLSYKSFLSKQIDEPLAFIKDTDKTIASYSKVGNGNLILMPRFEVLVDEDLPEKEYYQIIDDAEADFITALKSLVIELDKKTGDFKLPEWSNEFLVKGENEAINSLVKVENQLQKVKTKISKHKEIISKKQQLKLMFTGTGTALENQVKALFHELGFQILENAPNRDDLILKYKGKIAVVEIKGLKKSAAEKNAAQLEKWVSGYYEKNGIEPKGILLVNAFKGTPLDKRTDAPFPDQMLSYSTKKDHCLITGLQLLGLYFDYLNDPTKKEKLISSLLRTTGEFKDYLDFTKFLDSK